MHACAQGGRKQISGDESTNAPDKEHNKAIAQVGSYARARARAKAQHACAPHVQQ